MQRMLLVLALLTTGLAGCNGVPGCPTWSFHGATVTILDEGPTGITIAVHLREAGEGDVIPSPGTTVVARITPLIDGDGDPVGKTAVSGDDVVFAMPFAVVDAYRIQILELSRGDCTLTVTGGEEGIVVEAAAFVDARDGTPQSEPEPEPEPVDGCAFWVKDINIVSYPPDAYRNFEMSVVILVDWQQLPQGVHPHGIVVDATITFPGGDEHDRTGTTNSEGRRSWIESSPPSGEYTVDVDELRWPDHAPECRYDVTRNVKTSQTQRVR